MNDNKQELIKLKNLGLINEGLFDTDTASIDIHSNVIDNDDANDSPWFLQFFFGLSGILASLFFIGFLSLLLETTGALDSTIAIFIIGMLLNTAGFILFKNKRMRHSMFLNSLAFTVSVAGQAYVMLALVSGDIEYPLGVWLFLLLQSAITFIVPNFIYRLLSSLVALGCTVFLLNYYYIPEVSFGLLALIAIISNLQRYSLLQHVSVKWRAGAFETIKAIGYASALMLLYVSVYFIAAEYSQDSGIDGEIFSYNYYLAQGLLILASLYAAYLILERYSVKLLSTVGLIIICAITVLGIISVYISGLLATSLIIIIAIANSQRVLLGLGVLSLISYIFWYYYQLDTSLLVKSGSMLIIGIVMLLMRWLLISRYFSDGKQLINATGNKERQS